VSIGRPRCSASAWPSDFPSDGGRVGPGAPTARFENSHEERWAPRNSEALVAVKSGAKGPPIHWVMRWILAGYSPPPIRSHCPVSLRGEVAERSSGSGSPEWCQERKQSGSPVASGFEPEGRGFASQQSWRSAWRAKLARESLPACHFSRLAPRRCPRRRSRGLCNAQIGRQENPLPPTAWGGSMRAREPSRTLRSVVTSRRTRCRKRSPLERKTNRCL
jgi:hypothetical protein